jgi:AcrR family transcriptional regulator
MVRKLDEQKHEHQRQRLLAQARRLFASQGVKETSMAQVAKACKVTKAGLYHYFKGKADLLKGILECRGEEIADLRERLDRARTLEDCLYQFAKGHLEYMKSPENLDLLKIMLAETQKSREMKKYYTDFCYQNVSQCAKEIVARFAPRLPDKAARLAFYQFLAPLLHYTWNVKMVGPMEGLIGGDETFIRRLAKVHAAGIEQGL